MKLIIKVLKFIGIVFIGIVIFSIIMASFFGSNKRTEKQISKTIEKVDNEIVNNARQILEKEIVNIKPLKNYFTFSNIEELRTIRLGKYEQDNDLSNGKEDLEWIVLDTDGKHALLLSKYVIDGKEKGFDVNKWLNNDFYQDAFDINEQQLIDRIKIYPKNAVFRQYEKNRLKPSFQNILLLSEDQLSYYGGIKNKFLTTSTKYARHVESNGKKLVVYTDNDNVCEYWL